MMLYVFAFIVVGCAAGASALMKRAGYGPRWIDATIVGAIAGLVVLFAVESLPVAAMAVAVLVSLAASYILYKKGGPK